MRPPPRWRDDVSAPEAVRELIRRGAASRPMPKDARLRSAARLDRLVVIPAAASLLFWIKAVALAAGIGSIGAVAVIHWNPGLFGAPPADRAGRNPPHGFASVSARPPAADPPPLRSEPAVPSTAAVLPSRPPPALSQRWGPPPTAPSSSELVTSDPLEQEAALLETARAALGRNPTDALSTLDRYASRFPAGVLSIEGELLAVDALQRIGRVAEARERGRALLARARGSIYEPRIQAMLAILPAE
ncbi:MAG: hypothetical protein M3O36_14565 [Myxococcota bacterium]|nr:hypothetical protein [Myxococcota bacterium]